MIGTASGLKPLNRYMHLNRKFFLKSILLITFFFEIDLLGQDLFEFDESLSSVFPQSIASSIGIGDITGDGINDIIISGYDFGNNEGLFLEIYNITPSGNIDTLQINIINAFTYIPSNHSSKYIGGDGGLELGDYDKDGLLDILVHGAEFMFLTKNLGGDVSVNNYIPNNVYESLGESSLQFGDIDLDGDLDLFWIGLKNSRNTITNKLVINKSNYQENVEWEFDESMVMPDLRSGAIAWSDIDLDGDLDLLTSGQQLTVESGATKLYLNDPIGRLGETTTQDIAALKGTAICFSDLDNDADDDLIISGYSPIDSSLKTLIYVNEPTGNFRLANEQIDFGTIFGTIEAIDVNLDGYKDIALSGAVGHKINYDTVYLIDSVEVNDQGDTLSADTTIVLLNARDSIWALEGRVYLNNGNGDIQFSQAQTIQGARTISFVDIDQNGKPDLVTSGTTEIGENDSSFFSIYMNISTGINNPPSPPNVLESFAISNRVIFNWGEGSDDINSSQGLQYNLSITRSISSSENVNLLSDIVKYNNANVGKKLIREFTNIPWGTYYWKVQAVDASGLISEWSEEKELFIPRLVNSVQSIPGYSFGTSRWSDINDDNLLDLAITGNLYTGTSETQIYINNDGILNIDNLQGSMNNVYGGHLSFVDYTNDGHLDISMTGASTYNFNTSTRTWLYKWKNGQYVLDEDENQMDIGFFGGKNNHDWGDYDNDGDLDLISSGISLPDFAPNLKIFKNTNGILNIDNSQSELIQQSQSAVIWLNINNDHYLDLVSMPYLYINDGTGIMNLSNNTIINNNVSSTGLHALAAGDFNSDGFDDLAISYSDLENSQMYTDIYINDTTEQFKLHQQLQGTSYAGLDWGDYDNDGDLDLISSGFTNSVINDFNVTEYLEPITTVYLQNSEGNFIIDTTLYMLDSVGHSSTQWGDYDNDGDLDLLMTGETHTGELISRVYENLEGFTNSNTDPSKPIMLLSEVNIDTVNISWQSGLDLDNQSGHGRTPNLGIKYQLQMGEDQNYNLGGNTHSIISGAYGTGRMGARNGTNYMIHQLPEGRYQWRVKAIDYSLGASEWSNWDYFYIDQTPPIVKTIQVNYGVGGQIILVINFEEEFEMNNSPEAEPYVFAMHPDMNDIDMDNINDTLIVEKQSYSATIWTGLLSLPDNYVGNAIKIHISNATDKRGNKMIDAVFFKTPEKIISQAGGSVISSDGNVSVLFPQNAVSEDISVSIDLLNDGATLDSNSISNYYTITPSDIELNKPTILRIAIPKMYADKEENDHNPYIVQINTSTGNISPLGGSIISVNSIPYLQTQLSKLGVYAAFKSDSAITVDSLDTETIICQPRIFSPAGSVFEFPHTNILFDLEASDNVTARIFNLSGKIKRILKPEQTLGPGNNIIVWDGKDSDGSVVPSGLYIVTLESSNSMLKTTVGVLNR